MERSKVETYLGFCVRARKAVFGVDDIEKQTKGVFLIICDGELSENSLKTVEKARANLECPLLITDKGNLGELLHKPAVKAVAIKDKNLASAIISVAEAEFQLKLYSGGTN